MESQEGGSRSRFTAWCKNVACPLPLPSWWYCTFLMKAGLRVSQEIKSCSINSMKAFRACTRISPVLEQQKANRETVNKHSQKNHRDDASRDRRRRRQRAANNVSLFPEKIPDNRNRRYRTMLWKSQLRSCLFKYRRLNALILARAGLCPFSLLLSYSVEPVSPCYQTVINIRTAANVLCTFATSRVLIFF